MSNEAVHSDLAAALDPSMLMQRAGLEPDPWQRDMLRAGTDRILMLITRQGGKSTTTAARALHKALFAPGSLTLLLSPSQRQSGELFKKVLNLYRANGEPVEAENLSALRMELANESRIVALPGTEKTVRGFSGVDLLCIDEAARVSGDLYRSIRPMLAVSGGDLVALTTPWGRRGWFYHEWTDPAAAEWHRIEIDAHDCPRITEAFLKEEQRKMPRQWFESEYLCRFTDTVDSVFDSRDLEAMARGDAPMLFSENDVPDLTADVPYFLMEDEQ